MKKSIFTIICLALAVSANSQKLADLYKKGTIKLVPDKEYAKENDWNQVFRSYNDKMGDAHIGERKSLVIMPDGSVVVSHAYTNYYSMFSPEGRFIKEFGIKNAKGQTLKKINGIEGIINDNTFFTGLDNMGYMNCFNFNGKLIKTLRLNYMTKGIIPLPNGKIAVVGWVIWKDSFRDFISIVDYNTNEEKVIWEHFTKRENNDSERSLFNYDYSYKNGGAVSFNTMPFSNNLGIATPSIACTGNKLIVSLPGSAEIMEYDLNGKFLIKKKIDWGVRSISVEEQKKIQKDQIEKFKSIKLPKFRAETTDEEVNLAKETILNEMKADLDKISKSVAIPVFSTVIKDSDGNLLFFEYPKEEDKNIFHVWVYEKGGNFICQSRFVCDDYDLNINPSRMAFHKGYLYSLQSSKNATGVPMRLVRFRLTEN
jgi:hypothetical protein